MKYALPLLASVLTGCAATQTVLVNPGVPVRLAEPVAAHVYVPSSNGVWVEGRNPVQIPAGWYLLPPPTTRPVP